MERMNDLMYRLPPGCVAVREFAIGQFEALVCLPPTTLTYEGQVAVVPGAFKTAGEACEAGLSVLGGPKGAKEAVGTFAPIGDEEAQGEFPFKNPDGH